MRNSDWTKSKDINERIRIARYGLAAEVGSLAATLKRKVIHHSAANWNSGNEEIFEELGDCLWYTVQLATLSDKGGLDSIVEADLSALPTEIDRIPEFREALGEQRYQKFLEDAPKIIQRGADATLGDYQTVAFLTARTQGRDLLDVCITRLLLYATSVMSRQFPDTEYFLKDDILEFSQDRTLGMLLWHLAAVATIYGVDLDRVAELNCEKLDGIFNLSGKAPTPLHDRGKDVPPRQKFPLKFQISFISTSSTKLQMFYRGRPLGDELDDNSVVQDGYRFHDSLHLANAAILGWSPVLRSLMGLKRKYSPRKDNSEDGARARIVEEAIAKAVHSEAIRVGRNEGFSDDKARTRLFSDKDQIKYDFLKLIMTFAEGLEVQENQSWEWQRAIVEGHRLYVNLHKEKQGTVTVDLKQRQVSFSPLVVADIRGPVVDSSIEMFEAPNIMYRKLKDSDKSKTETRAILRLLGFEDREEFARDLTLSYSDEGELSVKADGPVQERIWERSIVGFRASWTKVGRRWVCMAMAIGIPT